MWWSISILVVAVLLLILYGCKRSAYKKALSLYEEGNYSEAQVAFQNLKRYKDSQQMAHTSGYKLAMESFEQEAYAQALAVFIQLGDFSDSIQLAQQCNYHLAKSCMMQEEYRKARDFFLEAGDYADTKEMMEDLPQKILTKCLEENGEISSPEDSDYKVILYPVSEREIGARYVGHKTVDGTVQERSLEMTIAFDAPETIVQGKSTGNILFADGIKYEIAENATGTLNIAEYQHGDKVCWKVRYSYCTNRRNVSNVPYGWGSVLENNGAQYLLETLQGIRAIMKEYDLPVTLQDIGFVSVSV